MGVGSDLLLYSASAVLAGSGSGCNGDTGGGGEEKKKKVNKLAFFWEEEFLIKGEITMTTCKVTSLSHSVRVASCEAEPCAYVPWLMRV